jgi:hypothetical protein
MIANPWVIIIAQYGLQFAFELAAIIKDKTDPTADDFKALITKYGTETLDEKLAKRLASLGQQ